MTDQLDKTDDVFIWKDISILQKEDVFKVGTDALLLGAWVPRILSNTNSILDLGSGTGILALIMHRAFPDASILAIDRDENSVALCSHNFSKAIQPNLLTASLQDLFSFRPSALFDLIVCNPPYFFNPHHQHQGPYSRARHAEEEPTMWMKKMATFLRANGNVCLVLPEGIAPLWIKAGNDSGLYVARRLNVYSFTSDNVPKRVLLHFTTTLISPLLEQMCIYTEYDQYSEEYKKMMAGDEVSSLT